jgi:hypothetical protein
MSENFESTWDDADGVWLAEMYARQTEAENGCEVTGDE